MVEIDYYSKYLKYKQKYLKQKNLQIGGEIILINIIVIDPLNNTKNTYDSQNIESSKIIKEALDTWFVQNNIKFKDYTVFLNVTKETYSTQPNLEKNKNFDSYNVKNNDNIMIMLLDPEAPAVSYD